MKKIIHLSDLHIGYKDLSKKFGDIVTRILFHKEPADNYIIVITGDIVEDALRGGSYDLASSQLNRLKDAGFSLLLVPGNHDYGSGALAHKKLVKQFKKHFYGDTSIIYPKVDVIDNMAFIGLDSMADELHWLDRLFAEGELGKDQLERLDNILKSEIVKNIEYKIIYLHHHPFHPRPFHHLKDSEELRKVLQQHTIDALLFGHNHDGRVWNGGWGIKRVYDAGTSTGKHGKTSPHRVIDLSKEPVFDYDAQL